ncbi:MAG: thiamine pyrophosphate-dependent enzyme, partial [Chloroflexota bacterium]
MASKQSRLHVPQAPARPGDEPDFSYLNLSSAGEMPRPDANARVNETIPLANGLVRVLDEDHIAKGPWDPHLDPKELQVGLAHMVKTRIFDDRMQRVQRQGKTSFYVKSTGEEAVSVAQAMALQPGDMLFPSYRNQGLFIVRGSSLTDLMSQCLSNTRDMCKGRQLPVMYHSDRENVVTI